MFIYMYARIHVLMYEYLYVCILYRHTYIHEERTETKRPIHKYIHTYKRTYISPS